MYDVFLSFRGEDTRHGFTAHLYDALVQSGYHTFRDDDAIPRGEDLKPEIEKAIKISKGSIIVLSINYANSRWCLDELWLILEQKRKGGHFVLPVFHHVDPSHVRNHKQSFAIKPKKGKKWTKVNVNRWKEALTNVANLTGMVLSGSEPDFIAKIVDSIDRKLDLKLVSIPAHLTGMDSRAHGINSWLKDEQSSAEVFSICGMRGSGKTTLAKYIYNSNKHLFESSSFLEEIGKHYKQPYGLLGLQKQLLTDILGGKNIMISNESEGTRKIEHALQLKRVLIVLDDIDEDEELEALLGTKTLHTQSKIIITTTFLNIDTWFGSISRRFWVQKLELLDDDESVELLSWYAFGSKVPLEGFEELSKYLADYCEGNPLALKVLGSSLYVSSEDHWKRNDDIEIWRSTLNSLYSLNGDLNFKIQVVLRKSYDSLPRPSHKDLFLHIAIFFLGKDKDYVVEILEPDWHAKSVIRTLLDRCLLTVSTNNKLMMHQLLQDMGRTIVLEESKDPAKRSRVWNNDESYQMLRRGYGSKTIEGLTLDMRVIKQGMSKKPLALKTASLAGMDKLKLLKLKYVELTGSYTNFPELRWLCWHGCHLKTLPFGLLTSTLVAIDMVRGYMEKFEPSMVLGSLKILKLKSCYRLDSICNLHRLPNLETLILSHCSSLTYVCKTIGDLKSLSLLNLRGCSKLWKDSLNAKYAKALRIGGKPKKPMFSLPNSLKCVILSDCDLELNNDVRVVFHAQSFFHMSLCRNLFELLPKDIDLKMLLELDLSCCQNLKSLPCLPKTLQVLYVDWCTSLETITFESARFSLQKFEYKCCFKLSEIQGLFKLVSITKLDEADLGHMKWIKSYEDYKVDLVGDEITKGRTWRIQMLYEYGIRSTYLQGIKDKSMWSEFMSWSHILSFHVPLCAKKRRVQGLNVTSSYRSSCGNEELLVLLAKISNKTKGVSWIYNPVVYCKPKVDEDVVWLSYWPIGNTLDFGDEVNVSIIVGKGLIVNECGASLVYMDDEVEQENCKNHERAEEVIGEDLSEFELTTGKYFLCRRDFLKSKTPSWLRKLVKNTVQYKDLQRWKKSRQSAHFIAPSMDLRLSRDTDLKKILLGVNFTSETELRQIMETISKIMGVEYVSTNLETGRLIVIGHVDPMIVSTCVKEFDKVVEILSIDYGGIWMQIVYYRNKFFYWRYIIFTFFCFIHFLYLYYRFFVEEKDFLFFRFNLFNHTFLSLQRSGVILRGVLALDVMACIIVNRYIQLSREYDVYNS